MFTQTTPYGLSVEIAVPYETALDRTRTELSGEGFGILTEIDVKATCDVRCAAAVAADSPLLGDRPCGPGRLPHVARTLLEATSSYHVVDAVLPSAML